MPLEIRTVAASDAGRWAQLYRGYRESYALPDDSAKVAQTWAWVSGREHSLFGLVATLDQTLIGLANLRWFARPSTASIGMYLDDLFVDPAFRGQGAARALIARAGDIAAEHHASVVRWITAENNTPARRIYDEVATTTPWVTYDLKRDRSHGGAARLHLEA